MGQAYLEYGDIDSALIYLHRFYDYCQAVDDDEGFGQASEALAICYQKYFNKFSSLHFFHFLTFRKADIEKSTNYLTKYLEKVSHKEGDIQYARACSALGFIHNTLVRSSNILFSYFILLFYSESL